MKLFAPFIGLALSVANLAALTVDANLDAVVEATTTFTESDSSTSFSVIPLTVESDTLPQAFVSSSLSNDFTNDSEAYSFISSGTISLTSDGSSLSPISGVLFTQIDFTLDENGYISFNVTQPVFGPEVTGTATFELDGHAFVNGQVLELSGGSHSIGITITASTEQVVSSAASSYQATATVSTVPEPTACILIAAGITILLFSRHLRKRRA